MFWLLDKYDLWDAVYEFAQEVFQDCIKRIEDAFNITDIDRYLDTDQEWYDEIQEEFYEAVYDKLAAFLTGEE